MNEWETLKKRIDNTGIKYKKIAALIPCTQSHLTNGLNGSSYFSHLKIQRLDYILTKLETTLKEIDYDKRTSNRD